MSTIRGFAVVGLVYGWGLLMAGFLAGGSGEGVNGPIMTSFSPITLALGPPLHHRFGIQAETMLILCMTERQNDRVGPE
jgi:hypothetical protein